MRSLLTTPTPTHTLAGLVFSAFLLAHGFITLNTLFILIQYLSVHQLQHQPLPPRHLEDTLRDL